MAKKISELSLATHSSVTPQARILVNEVNTSSSTGYTTKQMSIDELNQELMENYHYLTSGDSGSSIDQRYYYLNDSNLENWEKVCPVVFYDTVLGSMFVLDKNSTKRYINSSTDDYMYFYDNGSLSQETATSKVDRVELFDYKDEYTYVDENISC